MLVLLDDQTKSDLSCLPSSEENISVNAHFRLFLWEIHKLIWVEMIEGVLNSSRQVQDILQMLHVFMLTFMKELKNSTEWWTHKINLVGISYCEVLILRN